MANEITLVKAQIENRRRKTPYSSDQAKPCKYNEKSQISVGECQTTNENLKNVRFRVSTINLVFNKLRLLS
jgi:hypothetical protein